MNLDDVSIEVDGPHINQAVVRASLTVRKEGAILHRDRVNLTSAMPRRRLLQELANKGISLDERILVTLDEACRRPPPRPENQQRDRGSDISDTPPLDLAGLHATFRRWLLITDPALLPVLVGAFVAHQLGMDPVWLLIVAPPGGTKTEVLRALYGFPGVYPLSDLTARTFASGLDTPSGDPSLLARLTNEILVLKDFTTVLEKHRDERQAILAQLREIYDGCFDRAWGTGQELHWQGRLGFIAGVTPIIDRHHAVLSVLGERFLQLRSVMPNRVELADAALQNAGHDGEMRRDLSKAMHGFLKSRQTKAPSIGDENRHTFAIVADFVTRARSGVIRDGYRRELEYAPEPEAPTRLAKVLLALASGIALAYDSPEVTEREMRLALRVALDCLPIIRHRVIAALVQDGIADDGEGSLSTTAIAGAAQFSTSAIRRALEDLQALGLVGCHKKGKGKADRWELGNQWAECFRNLAAAANGCDDPPDISETVRSPSSDLPGDLEVVEGVP
jgi:hypothetical protein